MTTKLFKIVKFSLIEKPISLNVSAEELTLLFKLSKKHDIAHLVGDALEKYGVISSEDDSKIYRLFMQERTMAVFRYERQNYELQQICSVLEKNKIQHIPLKGSVLREYYDQPWKRTSCDIDVLVEDKNILRARDVLATELGYTFEAANTHDISLWAPSGVHLELHHCLIEDYIAKNAASILKKIWDYTVTAKGFTYKKEMTDEAFYFYHIQHMAKHFLIGGCGIRPFIDLWILNHRVEFDEEKRNALLKKGGLSVFAANALRVSEIWFGDAEPTELSKEFESYILRGGVYGNKENKNLVNRGKNKSKIGWFFRRVFLPYDELCFGYPKLFGRKWLYPFYTVKRWFDRIFKGRVKNFISETKNATALSDSDIEKTKKLLKDLDLI